MKIKDHFLSQEIFEIKETETRGVFKTSPIPSNISKYYESEDYISHHQDSGSLKEKLYKFLQSFNLQYKKTILLDRIQKGSRVLDYGCGINNIEDQSLDVITLWHVFEHVENQDEMLEIFNKKLKEKGLLIIAVPNPTSYDAKHYKEYWAAYDVPRHIYHFSKNGMENLISKKPNWKMRKIKPLVLDSYYISMLSEKYKKSPLFWLKAIIYGTISNVKALFSNEFSSLIYIIEKK
jgi:hypothetical protein